MRIATWNVNGIRSVSTKGFENWFKEEAADVVCLQETKANPNQLDAFLLHPQGYNSYWQSAEKAGYSGVAIYSKAEPLNIIEGLGDPEIDREGRVIQAEFKGDLVVINAYFPNSQRDHARLDYKLEFCKKMLKRLNALRKQGKHLVLCGDFNIAHKEIDLRNPKSNVNNAGFLPEERAWFDELINAGYVDAFRKFEPGGGHYTWWSYRPGVREKNIGWRLDYHVVNPEFADRLKSCEIRCDTKGSDHCPVILNLKK